MPKVQTWKVYRKPERKAAMQDVVKISAIVEPEAGFFVEKHVPLPDRRGGRVPAECAAKYPFAGMDVGDSFFVAVPKDNLPRAHANLSAAGAAYGKKHKARFTTRRVTGGLRIWRIV